MSVADFVNLYGGIYEHSAWVAERVYALLDGDTANQEQLARLMADCVDNASEEAQLTLLLAHPDLAGKAQLAGELTADSTTEQARAGLDQCSAAELARFKALNAAYKKKFGFPFIMAVRESSRADILEAFERRLASTRDEEFEIALREVHKIARLRLAALEETS